MNVDEVIDGAIKMEEDGYDFYKKAELRTKSKAGKMMFASLAEDEVKHKKLLEGLKKKFAPETKELDVPLPKERLRSVFAAAKLTENVRPDADDIEALSFAMGKEDESYEIYKKAADASSDPKVKAVFARMAQEENHHYEILEETKYYLEQFNNWSIWEENGPIEGG